MLRRLLQITLGLLVGVIIAELVFRWRDDGAFPHINFYVSDPELGVRLRPNATERIRYGGNPTSVIHTNARGFRGADWPSADDAASRDAIVVLGDSQVFGLGVDDGQTFSAQLAARTQRPVLNAGVPTVGPREMLALARELVARDKPRSLVFTINLANDLFELERPNTERHAVWDGWAVRVETKPASSLWFPGRGVLMSRSHLVYAARRLLHTMQDAPLSLLPSEGAWDELAKASKQQPPQRSAEEIAKAAHAKRYGPLAEGRNIDGVLLTWARLSGDENAERRLIEARGNPGDIVGPGVPMESAGPGAFQAFALYHAGEDYYERSADDPAVTAEGIAASLAYRKDLQKRITETRSPNDMQRRVRRELDEATKRQADAFAELSDLRRQPLGARRPASPLRSVLSELASICAPPACAPVVVVLPLDLQVAPEEWAKYDREPHDMQKVSAITTAILDDATAFGMRTLDALPVLRDAEPGAFLLRDLHMSPKGHAAVADAIATVLSQPAPRVGASGAVPDGRTRVPADAEFMAAPEAVVRGSTKASCRTVLLDEWLRVQCFARDVRAIDVVHATADAYVNANSTTLTWVVPVLPGAPPVIADFVWSKRVQRLTASRDAAGALDAELAPAVARVTPATIPSRADQLLCDCYRTLEGGTSCGEVYGSTHPECFASLGPHPDRDACTALLECARGTPGAAPLCAPGDTIAGGTQQCFAICNDEVRCTSGTCTAWPDTHVCMGAP